MQCNGCNNQKILLQPELIPMGKQAVNKVAMQTNNSSQPTIEQLNEAEPILQAIARANPDGVAALLNSQGFNTQGLGPQGLGNFMYKMYASGQFDINALNGLLVAKTNGDQIVPLDSATNKNWLEIVGGALTGVGNVLLGNSYTGVGTTVSTNQPNNSELIAGMQKSTIYLIGGIAVIVIALIIFMALKK